MRWGSYVALGDSFTEGLDDPDRVTGGYRGWADLVAERLAAEHTTAHAVEHTTAHATEHATPAARTSPIAAGTELPDASTAPVGPGDKGGASPFRYANLAVRGRLFQTIVDDQVPAALAMRPDLVSFAGGGNDALRRRFSPEQMLPRFEEVVRTLRASGADLVLFQFADVTRRLPGKRLILPRMSLLNSAVVDVGARYGARVVDMWTDDEFTNPALWSQDRLHLSTLGHRRVAAHVLSALGLAPDPDWLAAPPAPLPRSWAASRGADLRWTARHLAPWLRRRLTGRSSGDGLAPKRPVLQPWDARPRDARP